MAALRWCVRRARTWLAFGGAALATWLASRDHRTAWTVVVGVATALLAAGAVVVDYRDAHPDRAGRRTAKQRAAVDAALWRYERQAAARDRARKADEER